MTDQDANPSSDPHLSLDNILETAGNAEGSIVEMYLNADEDRLVVTHQALANGRALNPTKHVISSSPKLKHNVASFARFLGIPESDATWLTFYYLNTNPIYKVKIIVTRGGIVISDGVTGNEITAAGKDLEEALSNFAKVKYPQGRGRTHTTR